MTSLKSYLAEDPNHLQELRELAGVSQEVMAVALGVGQTAIYKYERGELGSTKMDEIIAAYIRECGTGIVVVPGNHLERKSK